MKKDNNLMDFLATLDANKTNLTRQQYKTIKGQVTAGDVFGAKKGLHKLLKRGVKRAY